MPSTYEPISTTTISGTSTNSITFNPVPQTYTDLVLVIQGTSTASNTDFAFRFNGDTGANYSRLYLYATGSAVVSGLNANSTSMGLPNLDTNQTVSVSHIFNYTNANIYKTGVGRTSNASSYGVSAIVGTWRSNAAITSFTVLTPGAQFFGNGTTLSLYGIKAA